MFEYQNAEVAHIDVSQITADVTADVITAFYNADGVLIKVAVKSAEISADLDTLPVAIGHKPIGTDIVKVFVWEDMMPLAASILD